MACPTPQDVGVGELKGISPYDEVIDVPFGYEWVFALLALVWAAYRLTVITAAQWCRGDPGATRPPDATQTQRGE